LLSQRLGVSLPRAYALLTESQEWLMQKEMHLQEETDAIL